MRRAAAFAVATNAPNLNVTLMPSRRYHQCGCAAVATANALRFCPQTCHANATRSCLRRRHQCAQPQPGNLAAEAPLTNHANATRSWRRAAAFTVATNAPNLNLATWRWIFERRRCRRPRMRFVDARCPGVSAGRGTLPADSAGAGNLKRERFSEKQRRRCSSRNQFRRPLLLE
jgi:hypothetical protein